MIRGLRALLLLSLVTCGCTEPTAGIPDAGMADAALPPLECEVPDVSIAETPETRALADTPARCGQPAYQWMRDSMRGSIIDPGRSSAYPVSVAVGALMATGLRLEESPPHEVATRIISYHTQALGEDVPATALVAFPTDMPRGDLVDVLLFLHGTTRFADGCGASATFEYTALSAILAGYGYLVVLPDYIGLAAEGTSTPIHHPYVIGEPTAHACLDAVRAALRLAPDARGDTCARPRVAAVGVSQGGHAALWVDRLAPYYAQELELVGTVAIVPPANLVRHAERGISGEGTRSLSLLSAVMLAANASWYGAEERLDEAFVAPLDTELPAQIWSTCDVTEDAVPADLDQVFSPALRAAAIAGRFSDTEPWGCFLEQNDLLFTDTPARTQETGPVLFITGEEDDLVDPMTERGSFESLCSEADTAAFLECAGAGHVDTLLYSVPEMLEFVDARFSSQPFTGSCVASPASVCRGTPEE